MHALTRLIPAVLMLAAAGEMPPALAHEPERQGVVELSHRRGSGVVSVWLGGGARVHVRSMTQQPAHTEFTLSFIGAELHENADSRGLTRLTARVLSGALADALVGAGLNASCEAVAQSDALQVRMSGATSDLLRAASIISGALLGPDLNGPGFERARDDLVREQLGDADSGRAALGAALADLAFPAGESRVRMPDAQSYNAQSLDQVRQCLRRHLDTAPIEAGVAGDITLDQALALARTVLAGLPARPRVSHESLADLRRLPVPAGPLERTLTQGAPPGRAIVVAGFLGVDASRVGEFRSLRAASRVLDTRVRTRMLDAGVIDSPNDTGSAMLYSPYPGFGMVLLSARVPDASAQPASAILRDEIDRLTSDAPGEDELAIATTALALEARTSESDPRFWAGLLSRSTFAGLDPDAVAGGPAFYARLTPENLRVAVRERWRRETRISLVIRAEPGASPGPSPP